MIKFPINKIEVDIEALGGKIILTELTTEYRDLCNDNQSHDNPKNGLINAGLSEDQYHKMGEQTAIAVYNAVVDLTYPNAREKLKEMMESGEYVPPSTDEVKDSKKN